MFHTKVHLSFPPTEIIFSPPFTNLSIKKRAKRIRIRIELNNVCIVSLVVARFACCSRLASLAGSYSHLTQVTWLLCPTPSKPSAPFKQGKLNSRTNPLSLLVTTYFFFSSMQSPLTSVPSAPSGKIPCTGQPNVHVNGA